jgi:hypothetical protein
METKSNARVAPLLLLGVLVFSSGVAHAERWRGFYEQETLAYWSKEMPPGIKENLREVVWPKLTAQERQALAGVALSFPRENAQHAMNFYAQWNATRREVVLPISSLRFYGDLALAYAWLNKNNYSVDPVTDYLAMLKYQWPTQLAGKRHRPSDVLGIPADARDDPQVQRTFQRTFGSGIIFVLAHELGHIYHRHPNTADIPLEASRANEQEADAFALEIMRRLGEAPLGAPIFFTILAHLESYSGDTEHRDANQRTHPVTASRIKAIARALEKSADDFSKTSTNASATRLQLRRVALEFDTIALALSDSGVQELMRQKGLSARPELLGPRRVDEPVAAASAARGDSLPFNGAYTGEWINTKGTDLPGTLILTRRGNDVSGTYSFGVGNLALTGVIADGKLYYNWKWGTDYFGKGVLEQVSERDELTGTWGYTKADAGAGTWKLRRSAGE